MNTINTAFDGQKYLNLETFRRNGEGVKTPVWFVQDGDTLYVRTVANSGKVKRIRNNMRVHIAPCKMDGELLGDWVPALAHEVTGDEIEQRVDRLLGKKYGIMKRIFSMAGRSDRRKYTILEMKVRE
ncbi:MAG: PPOX class F420-dependent oxidoreductase [Anaerolineales bacterium]